MSYITPAQAAAQKRITAPTFTDTAQRLIFTPGTGNYGYGDNAYPGGASFPCSFQPKLANDVLIGNDVPATEANLFFAADMALEPDDRVTITHLYGIEVNSPQTYAIVAGPLSNGMVMIAGLRLVVE